MIRILQYICLTLSLLNAPTFLLHSFSPTLGSLSSYGMFGFFILYNILKKDLLVLKIFLAIGLSYFLISGLQFYSGEQSVYIAFFLKFLIFSFFGGIIARNTTKEEIYIFLFIGALSVILNAVFFQDNYGRYSGFYLDPNAAGLICICGYSLTYGVENKKWRLIGQFVFTFAGLITFSRTFIVIWLLVNLISIRIDIKNIKVLAIGFLVLILTITFSKVLQLNTMRFGQLEAIVNGDNVSSEEINEDSRSDTWAQFYPYLADKPFFGNGFGSFQTNGLKRVGPHNSYLLIYGESGVLPVLFFIGLHLFFITQGLKLFKKHPYILLMGCSISIFLITNHNYFTSYYLIFVEIWLISHILLLSEIKKPDKTNLIRKEASRLLS